MRLKKSWERRALADHMGLSSYGKRFFFVFFFVLFFLTE